MQSLKDDPKKSKFNSILFGIPTFGFPSINFAISLKTEGAPIFTSASILPVVDKPVDVARNEIAYTAVKDGHGFVMFRDDDVIAPHNALTQLFGRLSPKQRANPQVVSESVVGGIVYSKVKPPSPMIYRYGCAGGFEDWNFGDLVECDGIGMGDTLIPTGVFNNIINSGYDKYQCVNAACPVKWNAVYKRSDEVCPHCGYPVIPILFKTVRNGDGLDDQMVEMTEDAYFCLLAKDHGTKIYADCSVQCKHEDQVTGTKFYFHEGLGIPVWQNELGVEYWPQAKTQSDAAELLVRTQKKKNGKVRFNIGCGSVHKDGFINMDMTTECDFKCDVRDLRPAVEKYGQADEIEADHVIEHFNRNSVTTSVRNWLKAMKPGGKLTFRAPDATAAMNDFLESDKNGVTDAEYDFKEAVVFGAQRYIGDAHLSAITENKMKKIIRSCSNMIESHTMEVGRFEGKNQDEIVVEIIKKKATVKPPKKAKKEKK